MTRRLALIYSLVSTYLVARLLLNRLLLGVWGVNLEFAVHVAVVSLAQFGLIELCRLGTPRRSGRAPDAGNIE